MSEPTKESPPRTRAEALALLSVKIDKLVAQRDAALKSRNRWQRAFSYLVGITIGMFLTHHLHWTGSAW